MSRCPRKPLSDNNTDRGASWEASIFSASQILRSLYQPHGVQKTPPPLHINSYINLVNAPPPSRFLKISFSFILSSMYTVENLYAFSPPCMLHSSTITFSLIWSVKVVLPNDIHFNRWNVVHCGKLTVSHLISLSPTFIKTSCFQRPSRATLCHRNVDGVRDWFILPCHLCPDLLSQWRTEGGGWGVQPPSPKFRSFDKVEPDCKLSGKCLVFLFQHPN